jgi:hypothetical protein
MNLEFSLALTASVSQRTWRIDSPNARFTPWAIAHPAPPTPMSSIGEAWFI